MSYPAPMPQQGMQPVPNPYGGGPAYDAPYQVGSDPNDEALIKAQASQIGPPKPPWFTPTKRIMAEQIKAEANRQRTMHQLRIMCGILAELRTGTEFASVFERDLAWVYVGAVEPFRFPLIAQATKDLATFIESMSIQLRSPARGLTNRDEATIKDDALLELVSCWEEEEFAAGNGSLLRSMCNDATNHGMNPIFMAPDPENKRTGVRIRTADPKTTYPTFSSRGLERVYRIYDASFDEVYANFADGEGGPATNKIIRLAKGNSSVVDFETAGEVIEWWNRDTGVVWWKGEEIRRWYHKLWHCPWIIGVPAWRSGRGMTTSTGAGSFISGNGFPGGMLDQFGREVSGTANQHDLARRYEPFFTTVLPLNEVLEQVGSQFLTGVRDARDPEMYWRRSQTSAADGPPEVTRVGGHVIEDDQGSELTPVETAPVKDHADPLWEMLTTALQIHLPLPFLQGQSVGTQSSGQAIDIMNETGYAKWGSVPTYFERLFGLIGHRFLTYHKEWAPTMGPAGQRGGLVVNAKTQSAYGTYPAQKLTTDLLERSGCYTTCKLSKFSLQGMASALASAQMLFQGMGLLSDVEILELLGASENPQRSSEMRRYYDFEKSPDFAKVAMLPWFKRQMDEAEQLGDMESVWEIMGMMRRLATLQMIQDRQMSLMAGASGGAGGDPTQQLMNMDPQAIAEFMNQGQGGPNPAAVNTAPGSNATNLQSPADIANAVGTDGGRLPGT